MARPLAPLSVGSLSGWTSASIAINHLVGYASANDRSSAAEQHVAVCHISFCGGKRRYSITSAARASNFGGRDARSIAQQTIIGGKRA